ncbi:mitochondrial Homoaconitase [Kalmusia sp. IMI 367209]|nr:mitochondrial Homoaconitase [Kalmusia sp. IMI 367209]
MSRLSRIRGPRPLYIFAASIAGGAAYRFLKPPSASDASLHPHNFAPYTLVDKQPVSSTSAIFTLRNTEGAPESESVREAWKRSVWSVQVKQPQLQIARAYTPLPPRPDEVEEDEADHLRLLIRQETGGEVSTYLHRLPDSATIELRGPNVEFELPHDIKDVIFLAGGTGIAPAMQIAQALGRRTGSKMHLLWANRRREECEGGFGDETAKKAAKLGKQNIASKGLIVQELEVLKEQNRAATRGLHVQYYVDEEKTFIKPGDIAKRLHAEATDGHGSRLILVSGPDGFIDYWAGKKLWVDGREVQGPLGGVLAKMDLKDWKVFKL